MMIAAAAGAQVIPGAGMDLRVIHAERNLRREIERDLVDMNAVLARNPDLQDDLTIFIRDWVQILSNASSDRRANMLQVLPDLINTLQTNLIDPYIDAPLSLNSYLFNDGSTYGNVAILTHLALDDYNYSPIEEDEDNPVYPVPFAPMQNADGSPMVHPVVQHMLQWLQNRNQLPYSAEAERQILELLQDRNLLEQRLQGIGINLAAWLPPVALAAEDEEKQAEPIAPPSPRVHQRALIADLIAARDRLNEIEAERQVNLNRNIGEAFLAAARARAEEQQAIVRERDNDIVARAGGQIDAIVDQDARVGVAAQDQLDRMNAAIDIGGAAMDQGIAAADAEEARLLAVIRERIGAVQALGPAAEQEMLQQVQQLREVMHRNFAGAEANIAANGVEWRGQLQVAQRHEQNSFEESDRALIMAESALATAQAALDRTRQSITEFKEGTESYNKETQALMDENKRLNELAAALRKKKKRKKRIKTWQTIAKVAIAIAATYVCLYVLELEIAFSPAGAVGGVVRF